MNNQTGKEKNLSYKERGEISIRREKRRRLEFLKKTVKFMLVLLVIIAIGMIDTEADEYDREYEIYIGQAGDTIERVAGYYYESKYGDFNDFKERIIEKNPEMKYRGIISGEEYYIPCK